jgi:hypothetical protein
MISLEVELVWGVERNVCGIARGVRILDECGREERSEAQKLHFI